MLKTKKPVKAPEIASEYLTTVQAAAHINLSTQFLEIARHKADGSGPEYIKLVRAVRYRLSALDKWMSDHVKRP